MREGIQFEAIFPIRDPESAKLMRLKADCLFEAGVIEAKDRREVYARSAAVLGYADVNPPDRVRAPRLVPPQPARDEDRQPVAVS